jgi:hypothetical protein
LNFFNLSVNKMYNIVFFMKLPLLLCLLCVHFATYASTAVTDEQLQTVDDLPFAPPQSRASNVDVGQGQNKCRAYAGEYGSITGMIDTIVLYSSPSYDKYQRLLQYDSVNLSNDSPSAPNSAIEHDAVVKLRCKGVTMAMFQYGSIPAKPVKEYYARCNNGSFYACTLDDSVHDVDMDKYYVKYSGDAKNPPFACRPGCDITRFLDSNKYTVSGKTYDLKDPIGYKFDGTIIEIVYKQLLPQDNVTVTCTNGTFLATSATGNEKTFQVSCDNNGAVIFPDDNDMTQNSTCTDKKACNVPSDNKDQRWGVYRAGSFVRPANTIPHNGYVTVKCGDDNRNDERYTLCVNGNYFPSEINACKGSLGSAANDN